MPDWDEHTRLPAEKEILGFFITGHPLEKYSEKLDDLRALSTDRNLRHEVVDREGRKHLLPLESSRTCGCSNPKRAIFMRRARWKT